MDTEGYVSVQRLNRAQALQLVAAAVVLGFGVNLIANYVGDSSSETLGLVIGAVATLAAIGFLVGEAIRPRPREREFEGFFVYDRTENELTTQDPRYSLGYYIKVYFDAAFSEDAAIRSVWDRNPIRDSLRAEDERSGDARKSFELVRQAAEYYVINQFSMRLSHHFQTGDFDEEELETLTHTDLPDVLLQNRFMRTFAEPMEDRAAFLDENDRTTGEGTIVVASSRGGALYQRFELVLPKGWSVNRASADQIEIRTKRFTLTVRTECYGWARTLPFTYLSDYLNLGPTFGPGGVQHSAFGVDVSIRIAPRRAWMITPGGWDYYRWIDEWIADLEPQVDQEAYLKAIGYEEAETTFRLIRQPETGIAREGGDNGAEAETRQEESAAESPWPPESPSRDIGTNSPPASGTVVEHASFGRGVVTGTDDDGATVVTFDRTGIKRLIWSMAPIRVIKPPSS